MSSHVAGQFPSHVSPDSTTPFPHMAVQFESFVALQPDGQHESPPVHLGIGGYEHTTLHCPDVPVRTFVVHEFMSSHVAGQFPSHVSPDSTTLLPQAGVQLLSLFALQPGAQQPSPPVHVVIAGYEQTTLHVAAAPARTFVVHEFPSSHVAGQLPSHVSPDSTTPLPHTAVQLLSFVWLQPGAQQPSPFVQVVIAGCVHTTLH
jgi:hypothetical protein